MKKILVIIVVCAILFTFFSYTFLLTGCNKQEKFEEAYIAALEKTIDVFKSENIGNVYSVTYNIAFKEDYEVEIVFYVQSYQEIKNASYVSLFYPTNNSTDENLPISANTYGEVYINGKLEHTKNKPSYGSTHSELCQYKNSNGTRTCTNKATRGELCEYHFKMLDDIYNGIIN